MAQLDACLSARKIKFRHASMTLQLIVVVYPY